MSDVQHLTALRLAGRMFGPRLRDYSFIRQLQRGAAHSSLQNYWANWASSTYARPQVNGNSCWIKGETSPKKKCSNIARTAQLHYTTPSHFYVAENLTHNVTAPRIYVGEYHLFLKNTKLFEINTINCYYTVHNMFPPNLVVSRTPSHFREHTKKCYTKYQTQRFFKTIRKM